jgi:hypothetical protein
MSDVVHTVIGVQDSELTVWVVICVQTVYSYSYSIWHGKAVQPTREPEAKP